MVCAVASAADSALALTKEEKRLLSCQEVMEELLAGKESIPRDLLDKAECVAVIPSVKKFAQKHPHKMMKPWPDSGSICRVPHMQEKDFYGSEKSTTMKNALW